MPFGGLLVGGIGAASSIIGGIIGGGAAKKAGAQVKAAGDKSAADVNTAEALQQGYVSGAAGEGQTRIDQGKIQANAGLEGDRNREYDQLNPYLDVGKQSTTSFAQATAPGGSLTKQFAAPTADEAANTPGFQFQYDQGQKALQRSAAAAGSLMGGGTLKASAQYGQGLASTYYQNAYNNALNTFQTNRNNTIGTLMAGTQIGQTATGQYNQATQNAGDLMSGNTTGAARDSANLGQQAAEFNSAQQLSANKVAGDFSMQGAQGQAAGTVGQGNSWQNALNGVAGAAGFGLRSAYGPQVGDVPGGSRGYQPGPGQYNPSAYTWSQQNPGAPPSVGPTPQGLQPYSTPTFQSSSYIPKPYNPRTAGGSMVPRNQPQAEVT